MSAVPDVPERAILSSVSDYYTAKLREHGATAQGVDWRSPESQRLRFAQLLTVIEPTAEYSLLDYGCGYGALVDDLLERGRPFSYVGFDIAPEMVEAGRRRHAGVPGITFTSDKSQLEPADYAITSGIFNVRFGVDDATWQRYVEACIDDLARLSRRGFAFNLLTSYSDADRMRPDLFYADPAAFFHLCKTRYSRHVALLHDYGLYEFTVLVRTEPRG